MFEAGPEGLNQLPGLGSAKYKQMHFIFISTVIIVTTDHLLVFDASYLSQFSEQMD